MIGISRPHAATAAITVGTMVAAAAGVTAIAANVLFRFAIDTQWKHSMFHQAIIAPDRDEQMAIGEAGEACAWFDEAKQPVEITSRDGLNLHGWWFDPDSSAPREHCYAICVHGYTSKPLESAKWGRRFAQMGFTVFIPAQRGHELSEGRYVGMGWLEHYDLLDWISYINSIDDQARILLYGGSMGASAVMMATGDAELPGNVVSAIAESGFTSARYEFMDTARSMFHMPKFFAAACVDVASLVCKAHAGYSFSDASCVESLSHTTIPMLFIHGGDDNMVNAKYLDMNYDACASADKRKLLVPGADHLVSSAVDPETYWNTVKGFVTDTFDR